ncbi:hypothetical protein F5Y19DRAFT_485684 [Xylariaceae sp. FL1651]|nr:hypothetical protein F5Y19DRAFT_485684 [Xylariaceae sp. FL1651]
MELAKEVADNGKYDIIREDDDDTIVGFQLRSLTVRIITAKDIDKEAEDPYDQTQPSPAFRRPSHTSVQRATDAYCGTAMRKGFFANLRSLAQEKLWLLVSAEQRADYRVRAAEPPVEELAEMLALVQTNWQPRWDNSRQRSRFPSTTMRRTGRGAEQAWDLGQADVLIVTDRKRRVVFANTEGLAQILYGHARNRATRRWSLYNACALGAGRINGDRRLVTPGEDDRCASRVLGVAGAFERAVYLLSKAANMIRYMARDLDSEYYVECVDILENLPEQEKLKTDEEDFLSLFALGVNAYTQQHRDVGDISGGLAGLITLGNYTGE